MCSLFLELYTHKVMQEKFAEKAALATLPTLRPRHLKKRPCKAGYVPHLPPASSRSPSIPCRTQGALS
jgi:hypothetical protein